MRKRILLMALLLFVLISACACSSQSKLDSQSASKEEELYSVASNISLKMGTTFDGETVLDNTDFIGFNYEYNESQEEYNFTFKLTEGGQKKITDVTTKLAETSGELSLWIGEELISSPRVVAPITGDAFTMNAVGISEENLAGFVEKLEGKQR